MYELVLGLHSWIRWIALVAGVAATLTAMVDRSGPTQTGRADRWGLAFMTALDIQMLLGLLLYLAVSPPMAEIRANFAAAMKDPAARFFAVEHITMMIIAVALAHVGRVLARKARTPAQKRMRMVMCYGFATLLMIVAIPWPGLRSGRPLFRI